MPTVFQKLADVVDAIWKFVTFVVVRKVSNCAKGYYWLCSLSILHIYNLRASRHNLLSYPQNGDNSHNMGVLPRKNY